MTKSEVLTFIKSEYIKTKWPFILFQTLSEHFDSQTLRNELNRLNALKMIKKRDSVHGVLIELLKTD